MTHKDIKEINDALFYFSNEDWSHAVTLLTIMDIVEDSVKKGVEPFGHRCVASGCVLTSMPPKYKCIKCGGTWPTQETPPKCLEDYKNCPYLTEDEYATFKTGIPVPFNRVKDVL